MPSIDARTCSDAEWVAYLDAGRLVLGGSDIGALLGLNRWRSPVNVFDQKLGLTAPTPLNNDMRRGIVLEPIAIDEYRRLTGRRVTRLPFVAHADFPFLAGKPDGIIEPVTEFEGHGVLEVKCIRSRGMQGVREQGIDPSYDAQLRWYMGLTGARWGAFQCFDADGWESHYFDVPADDAFFAAAIEVGRAFWRDHIVPRVRPETGRIAPLVVLAPVGREFVPRPDPAWHRAAQRALAAKAEATLAEHRYGLARAELEALLTAAGEDAAIGGGAKVTWRQQARRVLDTERLFANHPEITRTDYETVTVSRPFLLKASDVR